jgi:ParB-like chromosome segregation protein Spo0J
MKTKPIEFHPLCLLFPQMSDPEIADLADDIKRSGLKNSIKTLDGKILDGRNRFIACGIAGVKPRFEKFTGKDALAFVISENLHRRHLTDSQRAMLATEIAKLNPGQDSSAGVSQDKAATMLNVKTRAVQTAKAIQKKGSKNLKKLVRDGAVSLNAAATVSKLPKDKQTQIAGRGAAAVKNAAAKLNRPPEARDHSHAYTSAAPPVRGQKPPPRAPDAAPAAPLEKMELAAVTDAASAVLRLETIYEREKAWFNSAMPVRAPRAIVDKLIEGMRE